MAWLEAETVSIVRLSCAEFWLICRPGKADLGLFPLFVYLFVIQFVPFHQTPPGRRPVPLTSVHKRALSTSYLISHESEKLSSP